MNTDVDPCGGCSWLCTTSVPRASPPDDTHAATQDTEDAGVGSTSLSRDASFTTGTLEPTVRALP